MNTLTLLVLTTALAAAQSIPGGTAIVVRSIDPIESKTAEAGRTYHASLDEPLLVNGREVAPKGARALLKVVEIKAAGKLIGSAVLTIAVANIEAGAQTIVVETEALTSESSGKGKSTAKKAGTGAGLGAAIGALSSGGKGAAIGAAAGAGAGTAVSMLSGQAIRIPAETRLTFLTRQGGK